MSAIRRTDRRTTRTQLPSPYSRPKQPAKKPSSWRMPSWLSFLNPLISQGSNELDEDDDVSQPDDATDDSEVVVERSLHRPKKAPVPAPETSKIISSRMMHSSPKHESSFESNTVVDGSTPEIESSVEKVYKFLNENHNRKLNKYEVRGIIHELEKSVTEDKTSDEREPFRFSTSPSPGAAGSSLFSHPNNHINEAPARPRTLARNPNGTYQYRGVGSARSRPRQSPPVTIKLPSPIKSPGDSKRRKTDNEVSQSTQPSSTSAPIQHIPFPISSPSPEKASAPAQNKPTQSNTGVKTNGLDAPPPIAPRAARLLSPQPTTPAHPSPLRQAWNASTPSDTSDSPPASVAPPRTTRAAEYMTTLIQEVTPAQRPAEIVNPYQSASPVPLTARKPRKKPNAAKPAQIVKEEEKKVEAKEKKGKEPELSTQAIIEATIPKGSKRSRPPPELVGSPEKKQPAPSQTTRRGERLKSPEPTKPTNGISQTAPLKPPVVVEEVSDEDETPAKKRKGASPQKPANVPKPRMDDVIVQEMGEEIPQPMFSSSKPVTKPAEIIEPSAPAKPVVATREGSPEKVAGRFNATAPKEPSKLRFSVAADGDSESDTSARKDDEGVEENLMVQDSPAQKKKIDEPIKSPLESAFSWNRLKQQKSTHPMQAIPVLEPIAAVSPSSPSFSSKPAPIATAPITTAPTTTAPTVIAPNSIAPTATVPIIPPSKPAAAASPPADAKAAALLIAPSELPNFNFKALAVPPKSGESSKQTAENAAKSRPVADLPVFDFFSSKDKGKGKAPAVAPFIMEEWTCDTCMLKNPGAATEKCMVCDAPKVIRSKPAKTNPFNWATVGSKAPATAASNEWTCDTCMLKNPATATEKCTVCDAPKPGAAAKSNTPSASFNWAGAGAKPVPSPASGEWTCGTCMLKNPATATVKCTVCDEPKPGASAATLAMPAAPTSFSMPTATTEFNWAAAGMKAPAAPSSGEWTCGTCGLKNAASATVKCTICDTPR